MTACIILVYAIVEKLMSLHSNFIQYFDWYSQENISLTKLLRTLKFPSSSSSSSSKSFYSRNTKIYKYRMETETLEGLYVLSIIIASDNGLSPGPRQAIIWNNAGILSIGLLGTNFSEILIGILTFSFKKMRWKVSSAKWRPFCLGLNVLIITHQYTDSSTKCDLQ